MACPDTDQSGPSYLCARKSFATQRALSLGGGTGLRAPTTIARQLRLAQLKARLSECCEPRSGQAAGECRGEGEPELDRQRAKSGPDGIARSRTECANR